MCGRERIPRALDVAQHELERRPRHVFGRDDSIAAFAPRAAEQAARGRDARHREPRRLARARLGEQLQHGGGDHAERALGAEEQRLQVVARVVLAQTAEIG